MSSKVELGELRQLLTYVFDYFLQDVFVLVVG